MTTKILIFVSGGNVQFVNSNNPDTKIVIIDKDNRVDDNNGFISAPLDPDNIIENQYEVFNDESDPIDMEIKEALQKINF
jgi:hypothetical protein